MKEVAVLLHNIRSAHNVGSIFRSADAAGVQRLFLSGYTPIPVDRFGRPQKDIAKTALGAELSMPWEYHPTPSALIKKMRLAGREIVGIEQDARSRDYRLYKVEKPILCILGNEVKGISPALKKMCDVLLEIPMHGTKESLNVSVAAGIVLFSLRGPSD